MPEAIEKYLLKVPENEREEWKQTKVIISNLKDQMGQQEDKGTQCMFSNGICDHMSHGQ